LRPEALHDPLLRGIATFLLVLVLGWFAWPIVGFGFSSAFQGVASLALGDVEFGRGGHAEFLGARRTQPDQTVEKDESWNARVALSIEGVTQRHTISVNPRRLAYLPLLFFTAFLLAAPLPARRRVHGLTLGYATLLAIALISLWITIAWLFARVPGLVYDLSAWQGSLLHVLYEGFVTPIANKFIVPLALGVAFVSFHRRQTAQARVELPPAEPTAASVRKQPTHGSARARPARRRRKR
jgi:hypothetical protein